MHQGSPNHAEGRHFYLTYALARRLGVSAADARKIAWADQFTDELTEAELYGIQTQCVLTGNWADRQIQLSVLVPFHFIPGDDPAHPWMTTANSQRARELVKRAAGDLFQLGIALHSLQDSFSHDGFSGWREELNSCFPWYYLRSGLPNVGHTELQAVPDVVNYVWTDPRNGKRIDNRQRAISAAQATAELLAEALKDAGAQEDAWKELQAMVVDALQVKSYDERKQQLRVLSGTKTIRCSAIQDELLRRHKADFVRAACNHLAEAFRLMKDLPRPA